MLQSNFIVKIKGHLKPLYEITNSAMAANKEVIGYQLLILFLIFTTQDWYKFTNWQIFYIGKSGNRPNTLLTIGKLLVEITMWKLWQGKIYECIAKRLAVIGNRYFNNPNQYVIN